MRLNEVISDKKTTIKHVALEFQAALLEEWPDLDITLSAASSGIMLRTEWTDDVIPAPLPAVNASMGVKQPEIDIFVNEFPTSVTSSTIIASAKLYRPGNSHALEYKMDDGGITTIIPCRLLNGKQNCDCEGWPDVAGRFVYEIKTLLKLWG